MPRYRAISTAKERWSRLNYRAVPRRGFTGAPAAVLRIRRWMLAIPVISAMPRQSSSSCNRALHDNVITDWDRSLHDARRAPDGRTSAPVGWGRCLWHRASGALTVGGVSLSVCIAACYARRAPRVDQRLSGNFSSGDYLRATYPDFSCFYVRFQRHGPSEGSCGTDQKSGGKFI